MRLTALAFVLLAACAPAMTVDQLPPAPQPSVCFTIRPTVTPAGLADAERRYLAGDDAASTEDEHAAFRRVCADHEDERDVVLDSLHEHARAHAAEWHDWYAAHCTGDGYAVVDKDTGTVTAGIVCEPAAGTPPPRTYPRTREEQLAQAQRDACRRSW